MANQALDIPELPFQASVAGQISVFDLLDWLSGSVQTYPGTEGG